MNFDTKLSDRLLFVASKMKTKAEKYYLSDNPDLAEAYARNAFGAFYYAIFALVQNHKESKLEHGFQNVNSFIDKRVKKLGLKGNQKNEIMYPIKSQKETYDRIYSARKVADYCFGKQGVECKYERGKIKLTKKGDEFDLSEHQQNCELFYAEIVNILYLPE